MLCDIMALMHSECNETVCNITITGSNDSIAKGDISKFNIIIIIIIACNKTKLFHDVMDVIVY